MSGRRVYEKGSSKLGRQSLILQAHNQNAKPAMPKAHSGPSSTRSLLMRWVSYKGERGWIQG